jgi:hypothetical protein
MNFLGIIMDIVPRLTIKSLALVFSVSIPLIVSCATVVTFDVEHPPLVDLRDVNTITVIPFEWNSNREHTYLASRVTAALISGLRRGNIDVVDPYLLEDSRGRNYGQYADVYITGAISYVNAYDYVDTRDETHSNQNIIREIVTRTAVVDIEYSYIRSLDNKVLGNFKKSETASTSFENTRYRRQDMNQNTNRNTGRDTNRITDRRGSGRSRSAFPHRGTWQESIVESAILRFSGTMAHEIGPWTETERRNIKRRTGDNARDGEAINFVKQNKYDEALALYKTIYEQNGNIFAGYNAAILLAADEQFSAALGLLERLRKGRQEEGKTIPLFLRNEITKITEFINGFKILEAYKNGGTKTVSPASIPETVRDTTADAGMITGTVNLKPAMVYALNEPISSTDDNSIFSKIVAYTHTDNGLWSMRLPDTAPATLWLLVTDGFSDCYITKTAIKISGKIILDTAWMTKLF